MARIARLASSRCALPATSRSPHPRCSYRRPLDDSRGSEERLTEPRQLWSGICNLGRPLDDSRGSEERLTEPRQSWSGIQEHCHFLSLPVHRVPYCGVDILSLPEIPGASVPGPPARTSVVAFAEKTGSISLEVMHHRFRRYVRVYDDVDMGHPDVSGNQRPRPVQTNPMNCSQNNHSVDVV